MSAAASQRPYHHGSLREALIEATVQAIGAGGVASITLRSVAKSVGVTHGAARHHFGSKAGLLTAVAAEGFRLLSDRLDRVVAEDGFGETGVEYVRFATTNPGHFEAMFRPDVLDESDEALRHARSAAAKVLFESAARQAGTSVEEAKEVAVAAWSIAHGLATLWRTGNLGPDLGDPITLAKGWSNTLFLAPLDT
ncbi:TetR/AcrR family transcriptional regulator [Euzebya tangerina]|uniref:TetR/AcrR family transcriptional regulator n=1 Tax=Euzebya tangerina TaxID=591198 RepID=UPI000E3154CF|nr:TetR/AcrR family transcriptional regulator [Euzebya tangerina]